MQIDLNKLVIVALQHVVWFLTTTAVAQEKPVDPGDWLIPDIEDLYNIYNWRGESSHLYLSEYGDFNGDGIKDHAAIYVNVDRSKEGLLVYLGNINGLGDWQVLAVMELSDDMEVFMGMDKLPAGDYETRMCLNFDSSKKCIADLNTKNDSILYFRHASSSRIFWWSGLDKSFHTFWYN